MRPSSSRRIRRRPTLSDSTLSSRTPRARKRSSQVVLLFCMGGMEKILFIVVLSCSAAVTATRVEAAVTAIVMVAGNVML